MTHLEEELKQLKAAVVKMTALAISQLIKAKEAYLNMDTEIAHELNHNEKRINAMELAIDSDCENIFALFNPVATDLRFVIAVLKINSDLERIGDAADGIADYVVDLNKPMNSEIIKATKITDMFDISISMAQDIKIAIENDDNSLARKVYKKDVELNKINRNSSQVISDFVKNDPGIINQSLYLFATIRKLERVGDHIKNIAEDLIFFVEAKVYKRKSKIK